MTEKYHTCASCRNGEIYDEPATCEVRGRIAGCARDWIPYHSYLCDEHLELLLDDGAELHIVRKLPSP